MNVCSNKKNLATNIFKRNIFSICILSSLTLSPFIYAQEDEQIEDEGTVVITGSRIARDGFSNPTPTTVIDAEAIEASGVTNISDLVRELPSLGVGTSGNIDASLAGGVGQNILDLRSLGSERTLVLIDGKRQVSNIPGEASIDINSIPTALVERVDVITGGASAIYGADAVTGVINFVLKKDFEGVEVEGSTGAYGAGDGENHNLSVTLGNNFDNNRGNAWMNVTFDTTKQVLGIDRDRINRQIRFDAIPGSTGPERELVEDFRIFVTTNTSRILSPLFLPDGTFASLTGGTVVPGGRVFDPFAPSALAFDNAGNLIDFNSGIMLSGGGAIGGDGLNLASSIQLKPKTERTQFSGEVNYQMSDDLNLYVKARGSNFEGSSFSQAFNSGTLIMPDNANLPTELRNVMMATGQPIFILRYNEDLGNLTTSLDAKSYTLVTGADGNINDNFSYNIFYQYGKTTTLKI